MYWTSFQPFIYFHEGKEKKKAFFFFLETEIIQEFSNFIEPIREAYV